MSKQIGWDIGGAHLKAVLLNDKGGVMQMQQLACPLWLGLDQLEKAIFSVLDGFGIAPDQARHAVTMTGELVDLFANRHEGVVAISQLATQVLGKETLFYCMDDAISGVNFLMLPDVLMQTQCVASSNWHASASLLSKHMPSALLIDIGSTTTDIIVIKDGVVVNTGCTDADRMQQDSLVYTGVVRTPVMALAQKLLLAGQTTNVAAEQFATMGDVYRLTSELSAEVDMADTADGQAKTMQASAKRLARMVGHDAENKPLETWQQLAQTCREKQLDQIKLAVKKHIEDNMTVVGTGAGKFLAKKLAHDLHHPYSDFNALLKAHANVDVDLGLPAYAVAKLALLRSDAS